MKLSKNGFSCLMEQIEIEVFSTEFICSVRDGESNVELKSGMKEESKRETKWSMN